MDGSSVGVQQNTAAVNSSTATPSASGMNMTMARYNNIYDPFDLNELLSGTQNSLPQSPTLSTIKALRVWTSRRSLGITRAAQTFTLGTRWVITKTHQELSSQMLLETAET